MNLYPNQQKLAAKDFRHSIPQVSWNSKLKGLRQSEQEAFQFILESINEDEMSEIHKMKFLRAVETWSSAVRAQGNSDMNNYFPKTQLADKIEKIILQESTENLISSVRQQAMLCIVALSQVNPPFNLLQKLHLVNAGIYSMFSLPLIMPSLNYKENASLYLQTVQALNDMLQALVMDDMNPDMLMLQNFLEIILPWLTLSDKEHEQSRALSTIAKLLRFICNFPTLSNMLEFSVSGKLMGIFGLLCMNSVQEISAWASEALHYLLKILVLQRSLKQKTEMILKDLQKHFRGEWWANMQNLTKSFKKYLTPEERADVIMTSMQAMTNTSGQDACAASNMLKMVLKDAIPEIGKVVATLKDLMVHLNVPEIIQYICDNMNNITEITAQTVMQKILYLLAQTYTDKVILTLIEMEDQPERGFPWEILSSFPESYEVIMGHLLQRLTSDQRAKIQEPDQRTQLSPLIATRAIYKLLLEPSHRTEVQAFFPSLFMALLFQISCLVVGKRVEVIQDQEQIAGWLDPVSCNVEALKTLFQSSGYGSYVSDVQTAGGWRLLTSPEGHYDGVSLLARTMVTKNCWHNCPIFSLIIRSLRELEYTKHLTALVFVTELLWSREVAAIVDDVTVRILADHFHHEKPDIVKLLLRVAEIFAKHGNMVRQLCILQPYVLNCCYSLDNDIVMETFLVLKSLVEHLTWQHSASFIIQLTFTLGHFFEEEPEYLRFIAFEIYGAVLAKVKRKVLVFPLKYQILNLIVLLVLHLEDVSARVAQICRPALIHAATILGWHKLRDVFAKKDVWTILRTLLEQEANKAPCFLSQCMSLFKSPQASIRQVAVWFAGQIIPVAVMEDANKVQEAHKALKYMQKDPDSMVSCLATQTCYILEVREKMQQDSTVTSCFSWRRHRRTNSELASVSPKPGQTRLTIGPRALH